MKDEQRPKEQLLELSRLKLHDGAKSPKTKMPGRSILDSITDTAWLKDREGRFVAVNKQFAQTMGHDPEFIIGKTDLDLRPGDLAARCRADDRLVMESCQIKLTEEQLLTTAGEQTWIETIKVPILDELEQVIGIIGIGRDITERKRTEAILRQANIELEKELLQSQKLEAVGTLAGGIAHDFNNILTAIVASASLMQKGIDEGNPLRRHLDRIFSACERASALTQGILAYSRKQITKPSPNNLNQIIENIHKLLRRLVPESIDFTTSLSSVNLTVLVDSGQIEQAVLNLVTNAVDAMPHGGDLIIRTEPAFGLESQDAKSQAKTGDYALLTVSDSGGGMDANVRERIFEPFFTTKEVGSGSGLGLSVVYGIVKQHGGFIKVESEPGRGTLFHIYIPLLVTDGKKSPRDDIKPPPGRNETILLIEDDKDVRGLLKEVLSSFGYRIIEAVDGKDGVKKFMEHRDEIELLLTDVMMPKKNGKEAYNEIRKMDKDIKAIFISGYSASATAELIDERQNYLAKPVSPRELLAKIREVLDK